jgi:DNA-binding NarL/FixJ family response regulator
MSLAKSALIVAPAGRMRNSLLAYLRALPGVRVMGWGAPTLDALRSAGERGLDVVIFDADSVSEAGLIELVRSLRHEYPRVKSVILSNALHQRQKFLAAGADEVLVKGSLDDHLRDALLGREASKPNTAMDLFALGTGVLGD